MERHDCCAPQELRGGGHSDARVENRREDGAPRARCCVMSEKRTPRDGVTATACSGLGLDLYDKSDAEVVRRNARRWGYRALKRAFDVVFSGAVCLVALVPGAVLCAAIRLDSPGSPYFRQNRVGKDGKEIHIFKFRSMYADAHAHPEKYLDEAQLAQWRREQKVDGDPRITRIGRFIRKTSLDEVPQFLNVLLGDMSVVGPRPVTEKETREFGDRRALVLSVRPGITGLWQVTERNNATWENGMRQRLELAYVERCGVRMDLKIMFKTFGTMFGKNKTGR